MEWPQCFLCFRPKEEVKTTWIVTWSNWDDLPGHPPPTHWILSYLTAMLKTKDLFCNPLLASVPTEKPGSSHFFNLHRTSRRARRQDSGTKVLTVKLEPILIREWVQCLNVTTLHPVLSSCSTKERCMVALCLFSAMSAFWWSQNTHGSYAFSNTEGKPLTVMLNRTQTLKIQWWVKHVQFCSSVWLQFKSLNIQHTKILLNDLFLVPFWDFFKISKLHVLNGLMFFCKYHFSNPTLLIIPVQ